MNKFNLTLEHQFALKRCELYLQEHPEQAAEIALTQLQLHLEAAEECQRLQAKLKTLSLPPFPTKSHQALRAEVMSNE